MTALDDKQAEMPDLIAAAREAISDLECAESCETAADFETNIGSALHTLRGILLDLTVMAEDA